MVADEVSKRPSLLVITGPTATGKTAVAIALAARLGQEAEVVSVDSMMVYRGMNIGTAKPTPAEMRGVPHHMIDVIDPDEPFSVACYQKMANDAVEEILARGRLPMLVGGTGLYLRAVLDEGRFGVEPDEDLRRELAVTARRKGAEWLHARLAEVDPVRAAGLHPHNVRRVIRALEIYHLTGRRPSEFQPLARRGSGKYAARLFGLTMRRDLLYSRIENRVDAMLKAGLVDEVDGLLARGYSRELPAMKGLGYKEIASYLDGDVQFEEAVTMLKRNTRRFAKRQWTWFKTDERIVWVDVGGKTDPGTLAEEILVRKAGEPG